MSDKTGLGDRMKTFYEDRSRILLQRRTPVIMRIDGCHFHSFTKGFNRPFDETLIRLMQATMKSLCEQIQGAVFAYQQSDEISILIKDYQCLESEAWYNYNIQKMTSVGASIATVAFNKAIFKRVEDYLKNEELNSKNENEFLLSKMNKATFDCRVFNLPKDEVTNYFLWRQQDAKRNSIASYGRFLLGHNRCFKLNSDQLKKRVFNDVEVDWDTEPAIKKWGSCCYKTVRDGRSNWIIDNDMPYIQNNRVIVETRI